MTVRPDPLHILGILVGGDAKGNGKFPSALVRSRLRSAHYCAAAGIPAPYPRELDTAAVRRELERMRDRGHVTREDDFYWPHLAWRITEDGIATWSAATHERE